jgi:hypothetical protein
MSTCRARVPNANGLNAIADDLIEDKAGGSTGALASAAICGLRGRASANFYPDARFNAAIEAIGSRRVDCGNFEPDVDVVAPTI